jgi:glycosyltransferase involved in cell wall biosynthesis
MSGPNHKLEAPRRLLFVVNAAWFFISHRLPIAQAAQNIGYEVHIAAGSATADEVCFLVEAGFRFHRLVLKRGFSNPFNDATLLLRLCRIYRDLRPHIVHHVTIKPVIFGTFAARLLRVHAVVNAVSGLGYSFSHANSRRRALHRLVGFAYRASLVHPRMRVIFQNEDDRADFYAWTGIKSLNSILIAGCGVDLNQFGPSLEPVGIVRAVLPARMLRDKGVIEFAMAIGQLRSKGILVEGLLAGALDPENPESLTELELRGLEARYGVHWIGHCSDMAKLFSQVHIICLPSYREGFPKVLIEASAAGRAIVTTDVPGCKHVVENWVTGLLVPAGRFEPLAESIELLIHDPYLRHRLGAAARCRAERDFGIDQIASKTLDVYSEMESD